MEALLLGLLIAAGISIPISYVLEIKNACRIVKDAANMGYKLNMEKSKEIPTDRELTKKLFGKILVIPFFNLFVAYKHIEEYNNQFDLILNQFDTFGVLEKMEPFEKEYYEKKPTIFTAFGISYGLGKFLVMKGQITGTVTDKETNSEICFTFNSKTKEMTIIKATGIYEKMPVEEQKKEVAKTYVTLYEGTTEQYGSYENFVKEVMQEPSNIKLTIPKTGDTVKRDYAYEKEKLEEAKQEALRLQEIDDSSKEVEQSKVKKK